MKICLVYPDIPRTGVWRHIVELARHFVKDHEVHLLTANYEYEMPGLIVHRKLVKNPPCCELF